MARLIVCSAERTDHFDTQWASSITIAHTQLNTREFSRASLQLVWARASGEENKLLAIVMLLSVAMNSLPTMVLSLEPQEMMTAWTPLFLRFLTWSTIRAMRGDTMMAQLLFLPPTKPRLWSKRKEDIWKQILLLTPVGEQIKTSFSP